MVLLAGAVLLGLGMISASFAVKNVAGLFITSGVITGIGGSMIYLVRSSTPPLRNFESDHFSRQQLYQTSTLFVKGDWQLGSSLPVVGSVGV